MRLSLIVMCVVEQGVVMRYRVLMIVLFMGSVEMMRLFTCERSGVSCCREVNACGLVQEKGDVHDVSEFPLLFVAACSQLVC